MEIKNIIASALEQVRKECPLVLNITNYVAMNNSANAILAAGGSPIMSKETEEMEDMAKICNSLVINIGTLEKDSIDAMLVAQKAFNALKKPIVLDPVGAGATRLRDKTIRLILENGKVDYIRGNGSEIISVAGLSGNTKGVDSSQSSLNAIDAGKEIAQKYKCIVCISGEEDVIINNESVIYIGNGEKLMTKVTALGCSASAILGVYAGLGKDYSNMEKAVSACCIASLSGEIAMRTAKGPGSLQVSYIDALYQISTKNIKSEAKIRR